MEYLFFLYKRFLFVCSAENTDHLCIRSVALPAHVSWLQIFRLMENWRASLILWEQPSSILLMVELKRATICIFCNNKKKKNILEILCSRTSFGATLCKRTCSPVPVRTLLIATCKQPRVYQFPVVILCLSALRLHMIIDSIKRGPSIASRHLDLHLYSRCDGVSSKAMKPLTCPRMSGREGESFDKAAVIHFNFLIKPKYLLWIGPLKYTN